MNTCRFCKEPISTISSIECKNVLVNFGFIFCRKQFNPGADMMFRMENYPKLFQKKKPMRMKYIYHL